MNQHVFIITPEDADVEIRVGRRPRRQRRRCRHRTRPHTGSTADLGVELDLEVLPEAGATAAGPSTLQTERKTDGEKSTSGIEKCRGGRATSQQPGNLKKKSSARSHRSEDCPDLTGHPRDAMGNVARKKLHR